MVDLATRAEVIVQPLRVALVTATAIIFRTPVGCSVAFMVAFVVAVPIFYRFKEIASPGDRHALLTALLASARVSVVSLLVPAAIAFWFEVDRAEPVSLPIFGAALVCRRVLPARRNIPAAPSDLPRRALFDG